jgi:ATP-dependent DNA helicase RecQ
VIRSHCEQGSEFGQALTVPFPLCNGLSDEDLAKASMMIRGESEAGKAIAARRWKPHWLQTTSGEISPEDSLYDGEIRRRDTEAALDPVLWRAGVDGYRSEAQREAVRTVLAAPPGSTVVVNLPTGSGKSLCALLPALLPLPGESGLLGVTPIVVPTVALALDLEARSTMLVQHPTAYQPDELSGRETAMRCRAGVQGPVFLSPESLVGSLAEPLREAARKGFVRYLVIDEAHMVSTWGDDFRPAFQQIASFRHELLAVSGNQPFVTLLLSATLTPYSLEALYDLFGVPGPIHQVHAVRLRPEPSYWLSHAPDELRQQTWVLEALDHLPRPLILYTTRPIDAIGWFRRLRSRGNTRIGMIHGRTNTLSRNDELGRWNRDEIDIMVATSAFGLGVDKPDVRAVVHATCPEDIDRYYQDVGRGGRDGFASISLMVWTDRDAKSARRLALPTFIGVERGIERWRAMFRKAERCSDTEPRFQISLDVSPSFRPGDIDMRNDENERWNLRTLHLMRRAGLIDILGSPSTVEEGAVTRKALVRIINYEHLDSGCWETHVDPLRDSLLAQNRQAWALLKDALRGHDCISKILQTAYTSEQYHVTVVRACGGCPSCRERGSPVRCGRMIARHTPKLPWPAGSVAEPLASFFRDEAFAMIFGPTEDLINPSQELASLASWCSRQGITNVVLPKEWREPWRKLLFTLSVRPLFLEDDLPSGIIRDQATIVFLFGTLREKWPRFWARIGEFAKPTVFVVPADLRDPERPDRMVRDLVVRVPRLTLDQWVETYYE